MSSLPPIDQSLEPVSIRQGGPAAQRAYQVGLAFEQVLVGQLSQELSATASSSGSDGSDPSASDGGASGLFGSDPANSAYAGLVPQALTSGVMSGGGLGIALQIAKSIDPSIGAKR